MDVLLPNKNKIYEKKKSDQAMLLMDLHLIQMTDAVNQLFDTK